MYMNRSVRFLKLLVLFLIITVPLAYAQDSTAIRKIKSFSQRFTTFSKNYPQEKVYLHFDNSTYYLGESIWFKAYAVQAGRNALSNISKVLYVELVNTEGYVVETKKLKLENGVCHGNFDLNTTGYAGFYEVRAYTLYMQNFGQKNYFSRVFPVYDAPETAGKYTPVITQRPNSQTIPKLRPNYAQTASLALNFYPEGGSLVSGVSSKVAFKATAKNGENVIVSGSVFSDKGEKVADINTEYEGMGTFEFTPVSGKYFAKVYTQDKEYKFELPAVLPKGYTMSIDNSAEEKLDILIQKNATTGSEPLGLSISCRGVLYAFEPVNAGADNAIVFKYPKKLLPSGVAQITLYTTSGEVLSERLAFINHQSQMKINVSQSKAIYQPYEKVDMAFQLNDVRDKPVETTFSVSVRDGETSSNNPYSNTILTDLLLSSEVSGYIENPGQYFQSNDNMHRQALDLLLLTQGWSRYSWKQMAGVTPFVIKHTIEKELVMEGNVASIVLKKKMKNVDVSMVLLTDSTAQQGKCVTDSVGNFNFGLQDYKGEGKLILQSKVNDKRRDMRIMLNRRFSPDPKTYLFPELNATQYLKIGKTPATIVNKDSTEQDVSNSKLSMEKKDHLLKEVTVSEKRLSMKISIKYDVAKEIDKMEDTSEWEPTDIYGFLLSTNSYVTATVKPNGSTSMLYKGKTVRFVRRDSKTFSSEVGDDSSDGSADADVTSNGGDGSISSKGRLPLIDEVESISIVEDHSTIMRVLNGRVDDTSKIVLAVISLKKNYQPNPNGIRNTTFAGYSYVKEFYSPQYNRYRLPKENDYRRTLYWNPDVKTDAAGKAAISFFNNYSCKAMTVSAETVTANGVIGALNR
jgi:hypothetical protein